MDKHLQRALELAERGRGTTHPNPVVGAVVVDDGFQGVDHVIRGDDLVPSTFLQLLLYEALELPAPRFSHLPLVRGADGRRLAKRHGDTRIASYREAYAADGNVELSCADAKIKASGNIDLGEGGHGVITTGSHKCYITGKPLVGSATVKAKG